jgi:hypothetical protein
MAEKNILESIIDYLKPKAHDAIDSITQKWEESQKSSKFSQIMDMPPELQETIQGMSMGALGGGGGGKLGKSLLNKLKGRTPKSKLSSFEQTQRENILNKDINRKRYYAQQGAESYKPHKPDYIEGESSYFKDLLKGMFDDVSNIEF